MNDVPMADLETHLVDDEHDVERYTSIHGALSSLNAKDDGSREEKRNVADFPGRVQRRERSAFGDHSCEGFALWLTCHHGAVGSLDFSR